MGTSCDALALGVALAQPFADVVLSGAATPAQLQSNAQARAVRVSPGLFLERAIPPVTYWQERSRLEWS
jgi:aryl-alcohol dehydrogenase-like predicted oxidoreductase